MPDELLRMLTQSYSIFLPSLGDGLGLSRTTTNNANLRFLPYAVNAQLLVGGSYVHLIIEIVPISQKFVLVFFAGGDQKLLIIVIDWVPT